MAAEKIRKPGWKDLPEGDLIIGGGTAAEFKTGDWRSRRPVLLKDKCINCLTCWIYCPDSAIIVKDGKVEDYDYDHCKGCGICYHECPVKGKAIKMIPEKEAKAGEKK
jgi:pyruvate ferredoxin oxidoreductase delta subunit